MKNDDILGTRLTLPALADKFRRSTSWLRDVRERDRRFPPADAEGRYSLVAVVFLLHVRELERMSDRDFDDEEADRRRDLALDTLPGGPLDFVGDDGRAAILAVPPTTRDQAIEEAAADLMMFDGTVRATGDGDPGRGGYRTPGPGSTA